MSDNDLRRQVAGVNELISAMKATPCNGNETINLRNPSTTSYAFNGVELREPSCINEGMNESDK